MRETDAVLQAVTDGDEPAVRELLARHPSAARARGADGTSAIMTAAYRGHAAIARLLAEHAEPDVHEAAALGDRERLAALLTSDRGTVHALSADGWTPLHLAAFLGHADAAQLLLDSGADVAARSTNAMANTPLHAALAGRGSAAVVELLLARGADVHARGAGGVTPLHLAASRGAMPLVERLCAAGAEVQATMDDGQQPADIAEARGHAETAARLRRGV